MGLFDRVESRLERAVNGVFAKAFRAEVQPVEIASAIRRAMDDRAAVVGKGRSLVPNLFQIELSSTDFDRLSGFEDELRDELVAAAMEHVDTQHYQPGGPISIELDRDDELETGVFRVRPATAKRPDAAAATGRPLDADVGQAAGEAGAAAVGAAAAAAPHTDGPLLPTEPAAPLARPRRVNPADRPWLDVDGERYPLMGALTILGRDDSADIVLDDPGISRRHSEIRVTTDGPHFVTTIRDLGSTNGTFVNGDRVTTQHLSDGDRVTVGRTSVTYRAGRR